MMDEAALRREARRRKILENSQNRLNRISGVEQKTTHVLSEFRCENHEDESPLEVKPPSRESREVPKAEAPVRLHRKTVLGALAAFINVLLLMGDTFSLQLRPQIFLPFFLFEFVELVTHWPREGSRSSIEFLMLAAYGNKNLRTAVTCLEVASLVVQDAMLYFFVFTCCNLVQYLFLGR